MQPLDRIHFGAWNVVGYPFRRNASDMGNSDLLPAKCSRDLWRPAKFERHLLHEPAFRLDDRRVGRGILMDPPAVGKGQTLQSQKDRVRSGSERQGSSPACGKLFCAASIST